MLPQLKILRKSRQMSQQKLADAIGTSQQAINRYENQDIEPDINTLIKLADFFETSVDYLISHQICSGRTHCVNRSLSSDEAALVDAYRLLNDVQKNIVRTVTDSYTKG